MSAPKPLCAPWLKGAEAKRELALLHTAPCPSALAQPSLDPPHAIAAGGSSACFILAALHKGCHWSFQTNIYEMLLSFQCFWPGPALVLLSAWKQQAGGRCAQASAAAGHQGVLPYCLLPVPWGMAQNVVPAAPGFHIMSLNAFLSIVLFLISLG